MPFALAVGAGGGCMHIFSLTYLFSFSLSLRAGPILIGIVVLGLTALSDNISVYIRPSPKVREKMSKLPPAPTASAIGPCPTVIQTSRTPRH